MKKNLPEPPTLTALAADIQAALQSINGTVSEARAHSVESHLRLCIGRLGYKVKETKEKPATITELASQFARALKANNGEAPEAQQGFLHLHLTSTLSNLKAEGTQPEALKDIPDEEPQTRQ
jgi:hypothetical protein